VRPGGPPPAFRLIREKDAFGASVDDRHWKPTAARLLAPLLMAAAHSNRPIGQVGVLVRIVSPAAISSVDR
jgi:hypothetical protein